VTSVSFPSGSNVITTVEHVAAQRVLIKGHFLRGIGADAKLRFMEWVGNARFGVALPYNHWTEQQWVEG
jgi:hypothetical protein